MQKCPQYRATQNSSVGHVFPKVKKSGDLGKSRFAVFQVLFRFIKLPDGGEGQLLLVSTIFFQNFYLPKKWGDSIPNLTCVQILANG